MVSNHLLYLASMFNGLQKKSMSYSYMHYHSILRAAYGALSCAWEAAYIEIKCHFRTFVRSEKEYFETLK